MAVSLAHIAARAGVSTAAVSKALRDHRDISLATRDRIKKIAREMNYRGNFAARTLVTRKTLTIGVLVAFPHIPTVVERLQGIQKAATEQEYATSMAFHGCEPESELRQIRLLDGRVDGLLITPTRRSVALLKRLQELAIPIVAMSEPVPRLSCDYVGVDDEMGGRLVIRHLLAKGHREVAYLGDAPENGSDSAILEAVREGLSFAGCGLPDEWVCWGNTVRHKVEENMDRLMGGLRTPTAIFACNDLAGAWAEQWLLRKGLRVPEDIALVGFDDIEIATLITVPLSSVSQPNFDIGYQAASLLLERLRPDAAPMSPRRVVFQPSLVVRESSERSRIDEPQSSGPG
ncbi:LacI family DNA-binding transcriptional regulator [bacterium]|nr:LacI family DNA-binding transcriptional regulator [bacterium]